MPPTHHQGRVPAPTPLPTSHLLLPTIVAGAGSRQYRSRSLTTADISIRATSCPDRERLVPPSAFPLRVPKLEQSRHPVGPCRLRLNLHPLLPTSRFPLLDLVPTCPVHHPLRLIPAGAASDRTKIPLPHLWPCHQLAAPLPLRLLPVRAAARRESATRWRGA